MSHRWEIEALIAALLVALGAFLPSVAPLVLPEMSHYVSLLIASLAIGFFGMGLCIGIVAASRSTRASWPRRFVQWWDSMWTPKRAWLAIGFLIVLAVIAPLFAADSKDAKNAKKSSEQPAGINIEGGKGGQIEGNIFQGYDTAVKVRNPDKSLEICQNFFSRHDVSEAQVTAFLKQHQQCPRDATAPH